MLHDGRLQALYDTAWWLTVPKLTAKHNSSYDLPLTWNPVMQAAAPADCPHGGIAAVLAPWSRNIHHSARDPAGLQLLQSTSQKPRCSQKHFDWISVMH